MTFINAYKVETKNMLHSSLKVLGNMFKPVPAITVDQSEITPTATVSFNKDNRTLTWTLTGINVTSHILRLYEDSIQVISQPGGNVLNYTSTIAYDTPTTFNVMIINTANNAFSFIYSETITLTEPITPTATVSNFVRNDRTLTWYLTDITVDRYNIIVIKKNDPVEEILSQDNNPVLNVTLPNTIAYGTNVIIEVVIRNLQDMGKASLVETRTLTLTEPISPPTFTYGGYTTNLKVITFALTGISENSFFRIRINDGIASTTTTEYIGDASITYEAYTYGSDTYTISIVSVETSLESSTIQENITLIDPIIPTYSSITYALPYGSLSPKIDFTITGLDMTAYMKILKDSIEVYNSANDLVSYSGDFTYTYMSDGYDTADYKISFIKPSSDVESIITTLPITIEDLIPPTISFSDGWTSGTTSITQNDGYTLPTVNAFDENGTILTVVITQDTIYDNTTPDSYSYTYQATDASGNPKTIVRLYTVLPAVDTTPPKKLSNSGRTVWSALVPKKETSPS